jgi:hypothetical protein
MPSQMLDQTFAGLGGMANQGYSQANGGMNQFYGFAQDPRNKGDYKSVLDGLGSGGGGPGFGGGSYSGGGGPMTMDFNSVSPYVDALGMGKVKSRFVAREQEIKDLAKYQDTRRGLMAGGYAV